MRLIELYRHMARARAFELALAELWKEGEISGELHLGTGEEAIAAGVMTHLEAGDAVALDHRSTPMLTVLGVDLTLMLEELLGHEAGLCAGRGGHMHMLCPDRLAASSGIVGASGPLGAGFALAGKLLRPGSVSVAFFGDGAINQGMLMEAMNLACCWSLPLLFVCKDNKWAITTRSEQVTGGSLLDRARGFGLPSHSVDGLDVEAVWQAAAGPIERARRGQGPSFLLAECSRLDGHFLGDVLIGMAHHPLAEGKETFGKVTSAALSRGGGSLGARTASVMRTLNLLRLARQDKREGHGDPLARAQKALKAESERVAEIEQAAKAEVGAAVEAALAGGVQ